MNTTEKQLSWFALLMTAFYSLLASCRAEECGHDELVRCAQPLEKMSVDFVTNKDEFQKLCPEFEEGIKCINRYTDRCMGDVQREHFKSLYSATNMAVMELCQDGRYQEDFLRHAPCMHKVKPQFDLCSKTYSERMQDFGTGDYLDKQRSMCCSFQEYLDCSHHTVRRQCGDEAADFTKNFVERMASSMVKMHCQNYPRDACADTYSHVTSASYGLKTSCYAVPLAIALAGRLLA